MPLHFFALLTRLRGVKSEGWLAAPGLGSVCAIQSLVPAGFWSAASKDGALAAGSGSAEGWWCVRTKLLTDGGKRRWD